MMVMALAAVVLLMEFLREPKVHDVETYAPRATSAEREIVHPVRLKPGEVRVEVTLNPVVREGEAPAEPHINTDQQPTDTPAPVPGPRSPVPESIPWELIEDNRLGVLRKELPVLNAVLERLQEETEPELRIVAINDVTHRMLMQSPETYRGRVLTLVGVLKRFQKNATAEAPDLFEGWLFTKDSGLEPIRILSLEAPPHLPQGTAISANVEVTGYFFKRYGYSTETTQHIAPMLVARTIHFKPIPRPPDQTPQVMNLLLWVLLGLSTVVMSVVYWTNHQDRKRRLPSTQLPQKLELPEEKDEG